MNEIILYVEPHGWGWGSWVVTAEWRPEFLRTFQAIKDTRAEAMAFALGRQAEWATEGVRVSIQ